MSLITTTIQSAGTSLSAFEQAINVIQNNVNNASVPNYTAQSPALASSWFGVVFQKSTDARNDYAERAVWDTNQSLGMASSQADNLSLIQAQFDVSGSAGVPGALSKLYSAFSAWSTSPADSTARNQVLVNAKLVAQSFNKAATSLEQSSNQLDTQIANTVGKINDLSAQVAGINQHIYDTNDTNPSEQAQLYSVLQEFSRYSNVAVHVEENGTATVLLNGQVPLVVGNTVSKLEVKYPSAASPTNPPAPPSAKITANNGQDVTGSALAGGELGGLLKIRNEVLPSIIGSQGEQGSLNKLAKQVADRVNNILTSGTDSNGNPGKSLFTYSASAPTGTALTLDVDSTVTPDDLAAALGGVSNGVPNKLAALANSSDPLDQVDGSTYTAFYGKMASGIGSRAANAAADKTSRTDQLTQAENLRSQVSGISLNEQAAMLMQYQQAYQAVSQMISVVNNLTGYLMNMVGNS